MRAPRSPHDLSFEEGRDAWMGQSRVVVAVEEDSVVGAGSGEILNAMSREDVEVVRRLFAALDDQDWEEALGAFDPEVEWSPTEGTFRGPEGVVMSLAEWLEPWDEHQIEAEEFLKA